MPGLRMTQQIELNYRVDGSGAPVWLLFNGATLPLEFWDPVAARLSDAGTVVRFDQRNAGATRAEGAFSVVNCYTEKRSGFEVRRQKIVVLKIRFSVENPDYASSSGSRRSRSVTCESDSHWMHSSGFTSIPRPASSTSSAGTYASR